MLNLPKTTEFNKKIPKQKFYENLEISPALKKIFVEQIKAIYWTNKIASTTTNLAKGTNVTEIEVFEIRLNSQTFDDSLLKQIDKEIPYHILFLLEYEGKYQAWIGYKEASNSSNQAFKVNSRYYHTEWLEKDNLPVKLEGLDIDAVYENFVKQIRGSVECEVLNVQLSLKEMVEKDEKKQSLQKQIATLQASIKKEKQFNKQVEMNAQLKKLKKELEELN